MKTFVIAQPQKQRRLFKQIVQANGWRVPLAKQIHLPSHQILREKTPGPHVPIKPLKRGRLFILFLLSSLQLPHCESKGGLRNATAQLIRDWLERAVVLLDSHANGFLVFLCPLRKPGQSFL